MTKNQNKSVDTELTQISVPTKKINLEVTEQAKIEIILRPFKQRHFGSAIAIINKYFDQFNSVRQSYVEQRKGILDKYEDEVTRNLALAELDAGFNEGMEIAKAILADGGDVGEDIKTIIRMSIHKATQVISGENGTERSPIDPDLDELTWGECLVLLGSTVGLNMDFFAQNSQAMNLMTVMDDAAKPKQAPKAGEKSSPDSSKLTTASVK
jgi:hypothetical protein